VVVVFGLNIFWDSFERRHKKLDIGGGMSAMGDEEKTRQQLIDELKKRYARVAELEKIQERHRKDDEPFKNSDEKLRRIFESVKDGIVFTDLDGNIVEINNRILQLGEYASKSEVIGINALDTITPSDREKALKNMMELMKTGVVGTEEFNLIKSDGTVYPSEITASLMKDESGNPVGFVSVIRDITERKETVEALSESEERLRILFETTKEGLVTVDSEGKILSANPAAAKLLGYSSHEDLIGMQTQDFYIDLEQREVILKELKKKDFVKDFEISVKRKDGTVAYVLLSITVQNDEKGNFLRSDGIFRDITERKKAEEALKSAAQQWKDTFDAINDSVCIIDMDRRMVQCNEATNRLLNKPSKYILKHDCCELFHGSPEPIKECPMIRMIETSKRESMDLQIEGKWFNVTVDPIRDSEGDLVGAVHIMKDVTKIKNVEEELRASEKKFRLVAENIQDVFWLSTPGIKEMIYISPGYEKIWGRSLESLYESPQSFIDAIHLEDQERVKAGLKEHAQGKWDFEYRIVRPDGSIRWIKDRGFPIYDEEGNLYRMTGIATDINERKKTEEALRKSEEKRRLFMDSATESFTIWDAELNLIEENKVSNEFLPPEMRLESRIGKNMADMMPDLRMSGRYDKYMNVIKTGVPLVIKDLVPPPKFGKKHWMARAFKVGSGLGIITTDITEQKKVEKALKESEEKYRSLVEHIPDVTWTTDENGVTIYISPNVEKIYGYTPKEIYKAGEKLWFGRIHTEDVSRVKKAFNALLKKGRPLDIEYRIQRKDGEWIWLEDRSIGTYEKEGVKYADGVFFDITKRKRAEEELIRHSTAVKMSSESVLISDLDGNILDLNDATVKMVGVSSRNELLGKKAIDIISPEDRMKVRTITIDLIKKGHLKNIEYLIQRKDGTKIPVELSASVMRDPQGKPIGIVGISRDISERKRAETEMRKRLMRFDIANGNTYLVKESVTNISVQAFKDLLNIGYNGTVISRTPIKEFTESIKGEFEFFWLAEKEESKSLTPKLGEIQKKLEKLGKNDVVLLDRLDYIIQKNGFKKTLVFIQRQRERAYISGCIFIFSIDPSTLNPMELRLLEKESKEVLPQQTIPLGDDLTEIMNFVYNQNLLGIMPSHTVLCRELDISKPTARKRIRNLVSFGFIREGKKGRTKVMELTEKGRTFFRE
jgi:PAS domain S-box-containing protein